MKRSPQDILILRDHYFKGYLQPWCICLPTINGATIVKTKEEFGLFRNFCCNLNFDHQLSLKSNSCKLFHTWLICNSVVVPLSDPGVNSTVIHWWLRARPWWIHLLLVSLFSNYSLVWFDFLCISLIRFIQ